MIPSPGMTKGFTDGLLSTTRTTPPYGFMEMGGESARFAVSLELEDYSKYTGFLREVKIANKVYKVYVKTWFGHGSVTSESESTIPHDPCLPKEYAYRLSSSDKTVLGTANFADCLKETFSLLGCRNEECLAGNLCIYRPIPNSANVAGGDQPAVGCLLRDRQSQNPLMSFDTKNFRGASVYWHATHGIFEISEPDDFSLFWNEVVRLSGKHWDDLKADKASQKSTRYKHLLKSYFHSCNSHEHSLPRLRDPNAT